MTATDFDEALAELECERFRARTIARNSVFADLCAEYAALAYSPEYHEPRMTAGGPLTFIDYWIHNLRKTQH